MTELIKEVTPPKKPDLVNPYEAANPMIKPAPKKQPVRRTRAATRAGAQAPKKDPELTPQAIIEATVPKVCHSVVRDVYANSPCCIGKQAVATAARAHWS